MRKNSWAVACLFLFLAACSSNAYRKLRLELPAFSPVKLDDFLEVVITPFLVADQPPGIDLNKEIADYLKPELQRKFKGRVTLRQVPLEGEDAFKKPEYWQSLAAGSSKSLVVTGRATLNQETRKAILSRPVRSLEEESLSPQRGLDERRIFTLEVSLYLIKAETGETLLQRDFKETKSYTNPNQRTDFAFYDLIQRVKAKLFRLILGEERIQDRYLLTR
jgi:hypothetical protein